MYEEEILDTLKEINTRLKNLENIFAVSRGFGGGADFQTCLMRIMYGVE